MQQTAFGTPSAGVVRKRARAVVLTLVCASLGGAACARGRARLPASTCIGPSTVRFCADSYCGDRSCRGDELCQQGECMPWHKAELTADFDVGRDEHDPLRITCKVQDGGFPRAFAEHVHFAFGDGASGWGESLAHTYDQAGVYAVDLEVELEGYRVLRASRLVTVGRPSPASHSPVTLTIDEIPSHLNGSRPYRSTNGTANPSDDYERGFYLVAPTSGFSVDVTLHALEGHEVDLESLVLTADQALGGGRLPPGTNLARRLSFRRGASPPTTSIAAYTGRAATARAPRGRWLVGRDEAFPPGLVQLRLAARTLDGRWHTRQLRFAVEELPAERQPFDRRLVWLLRFDTDYYGIAGGSRPDGLVSMSARRGADGKADFAAELALLGAQSDDRAPGARTVTGRGKAGASAIYLAWIEHEIKAHIYSHFHMADDGTPLDGIGFRIYTDSEPGAPTPASFRPHGNLSILRFGGTLGGDLGRSYFGVYNERRVDDSGPDVGVATADILDALGSIPALSYELAGIKPGVGTPVGEHPLDGVVLDDLFDRFDPANTPHANARHDELRRAARFVAIIVATIAAHEMGHGMGLVPNGPPPDGFFGGRKDVSFLLAAHTDSHHAAYPPLNLMQAGDAIATTLRTALGRLVHPADASLADLARGFAYEARLSPYERAYLQGRLTYRNFDGPTRDAWIGCR